MKRRLLTIVLAAGALAACDDATGPAGTGTLAISFATVPTAPAGAGLAALRAPGSEPAPAIVVAGSNGTLTLDEIWVILSEFELEGDLDACDGYDGDDDLDGELEDDDCEEFESPPMLVRIPTDGTDLTVMTGAVPFGSYTELEWEVEDTELDEDGEDAQELADVRADIDARFGPGVWPAEASMAVVGSFLPAGASQATAFTTFFDAEIEVELDLVPPLTVHEDGASRELVIVLSPGLWFRTTGGNVLDLAQLSGQVVELEGEFENGIQEIERDDD